MTIIETAASDATAARPPVRASSAQIVSGRVRVELLTFMRVKDQVIFTFLFPTLLFVIFASVFSDESAGAIAYPHYFLPGMIASGLLLVSFQNLAITIALERSDGTLKRLAGTPMPPAAYFAGKIALVLAIGTAQLLLLLAVATIGYGVPLPTGAGPWLTFAWVALLAVTSGTLTGIAFSSLPRSGKSASAVVTPVVLVLQFISGVFFAIGDVPPWMRRVAEFFPLKWVAQGMRSVFLPESYAAVEPAGSWQHAPMAIVLVGWCILGLVLSLRTFRWSGQERG